jgi:hypothetical protein
MRHPAGSKPVPAIILVHGGGWEAGDKVTYVTRIEPSLAGWRGFQSTIDSRLITHSDQLEDLRQASSVRTEHSLRHRSNASRPVRVRERAHGDADRG